MKKKSIIILISVGLIILLIGVILLNKNNIIVKQSKLEIIDATYTCVKSPEKFYEDDLYIYSFPCIQSKSMYVKFKNGNKMLIVDALEAKKVTIEELIEAGLEVYKQEKTTEE